MAEVLITLGIIGVVVAITMPQLIANIQDKTLNELTRNTKYRLTLATDNMKSLGLIGAYPTTEDFVNELKKHFKILKVCDSNNLASCWPSQFINTPGDANVNPATLTTGEALKAIPLGTKNTSSVGLVTADGIAMILVYSPRCQALEPERTYSWSAVDNKPETNATTNCISAVFDVNGAKKPNKLGKDVRTLNSFFGAKKFPPSYVRAKDCNSALLTKLGAKTCLSNGNDYWLGAAKKCDEYGLRLPSPQTMANVAGSQWGVSNVGALDTVGGRDTILDDESSVRDMSTFQGCFATSQEIDSKYAIRRCNFMGGVNYSGAGSTARDYSLWAAICTAD